MVKHDWATEDLRPWVEASIELFGADRCMFASNFPVDWLFSNFDELLGAFINITKGYSAEEREKLFVTNAERTYRI